MTSRFGSGENAADVSGAPDLVGFVEYLISQTLTRWPAAMLFAISAFLFFHNLQPHWTDYRKKFGRRLRTVVVPFLLWSALGLTLYLLLQATPQSTIYFSRDFLGEASPGRIADKLFLHPVAYPLWFLQTLVVCLALAPLLYWPARALRWLAPVPFAVLWILGAAATNWNDWKGLTFFALGAVIALERRRGVRLSPPPWAGRVLFPIWMLACGLFTAFLRDDDAFWAQSLHKGLMCLAVAAVWLGYEAYLRPLEHRRLTTLMLPFTFIIFVAQEPLLTMVKRVGLHVLGASDAAMLVVYFAAPLVTLVTVTMAGAAVWRYLPIPYAWLTGDRGHPADRTEGRAGRRTPARDDSCGTGTSAGGPSPGHVCSEAAEAG
jgi:hypothetical protein